MAVFCLWPMSVANSDRRSKFQGATVIEEAVSAAARIGGDLGWIGAGVSGLLTWASNYRSGNRHADRRHDLVRERLPLGIPQWKQVADVADCRVHEVGELTDERHPKADWLAGCLGDHLELQRGFSDCRAG